MSNDKAVPEELPGQLSLFDTWQDYEPLCDECGTTCTSSKECVEISGLYDQYGADPEE